MKLTSSKNEEEKKLNITRLLKYFFGIIFAVTTIVLIGYTGFEILQFKVVYQVEDTLFSIAVITVLSLLSGGFLSSAFTTPRSKQLVRLSILIAIFTFYCLLLLNLLFTSRHSWFSLSFDQSIWRRFEQNVNLVPFHTILNYISNSSNDPLSTILTNLIGNFFAFMPMAFFLPVFVKKLRRIGFFTLIMALGIIMIELIQGFTNLGTCDIDDLILNLAGAIIGFYLCKIPFITRLRNW